jgi:hypothetical protein
MKLINIIENRKSAAENRELASNQKVKELAIAYTNLGEFAKLPPSPEFRQFLNCKRAAYRDYITNNKSTSHVWYPSDIIVARENGLPDDWMAFLDPAKESSQKVKALAIEYKKLGEFAKLSSTFKLFLKHKRMAYKDYTLGTKTTNAIWYPSDISAARENGLPDDWMITKSWGGLRPRRDM